MNQHQTTLAGPPRVKGVLKVVTTEDATLRIRASQPQASNSANVALIRGVPPESFSSSCLHRARDGEADSPHDAHGERDGLRAL